MIQLTKTFFFDKKYLLFAVVFVLSCVMMLLGEREKVKFGETVVAAIFSSGERVFSKAIQMSQLWRENQFLRRRNINLSMGLQRLREAELENIRLRRLLDFKQKSGLSLLPAEVIATSGSQGINSITIAIGSQEGIKQDMPVVTAEGLVGRTTKVFLTCSVVQLLLDRNCRVSAVVQNQDRSFGIVEWEGGQKLKLKGIPLRSNIQLEDVVISSGMGGIFPKGLQIGKISKIEGQELGLFKKVELTPSVQFSRLEEVFVLIE